MKTIDQKNKTARLAGFLYLLLAITGTFPFLIEEKLVVFGDAQTTAANLLSSQSLFIASIVSELVMSTIWILIGIALYALFKKVNKNIAFLMVSLVLVGGAIIYINVVSQIAALIILKNATGYLATFDTEQINALVMLFIDIGRDSSIANYIFMGLWMFPFAYLVVKSEYFPKTISKIWGVLLVIGGLGYIIDFITFFIFPDYFIDFTSFAFGGDLFSIIWLLFVGIRKTTNLHNTAIN